MSQHHDLLQVRQNAIELVNKYPLAPDAVHKSFYVDDGLTGADNIESAIALQRQLQYSLMFHALEVEFE